MALTYSTATATSVKPSCHAAVVTSVLHATERVSIPVQLAFPSPVPDCHLPMLPLSCLLQAQRLAAVDAMLRNGADSGAGGVSPDLESKLRRLATDVRHLKDRMAELTAGGTGSGQVGCCCWPSAHGLK